MTDKEIIARQAAEIIELRDKLAESEEVRNHWFREAQRSIRIRRMDPVEEHNLFVDLLRQGVKF
ncbi:hypothetical protein CAFE_18590 [Caprobacter fermentans]|uniref:Uncharacterized protein n=1 Tax=Caproicibacter fermentans TaxID=2576756 RepID=A0A6N8I0U0_9FIRM|nr:hypothetical protein [Caproicibacter fermentans]MVB11153.1 hypothetical protein [Caproicibacter fermentans]